MRILHTESSTGWGGQEIRILREAEGMRGRGHEVVFAVNVGGKLIPKAREAGFTVYEIPFAKSSWIFTLISLLKILKRHEIDLVNTHSSLDAWIGGIAARLRGKIILRTRHLSTPIRKGLNSRLLYKGLADFVVTTSSSILEVIASQAKQSRERMRCIPTGVDVSSLRAERTESEQFRQMLGVAPREILVGTACFVRSWKGICDLLKAAVLLKHRKEIKWVVVGGGYVDDYRHKIPEMGLEGIVTFAGHLDSPFAAIQAMDIFTLLSTAHEGISQATLQAAFFKRPMITTTVGGLPEVCIEGKTGFVVPPFSPEEVARKVEILADNGSLRSEMGKEARRLVDEKFTFLHMLDEMESVYSIASSKNNTFHS